MKGLNLENVRMIGSQTRCQIRGLLLDLSSGFLSHSFHPPSTLVSYGRLKHLRGDLLTQELLHAPISDTRFDTCLLLDSEVGGD